MNWKCWVGKWIEELETLVRSWIDRQGALGWGIGKITGQGFLFDKELEYAKENINRL